MPSGLTPKPCIIYKLWPRIQMMIELYKRCWQVFYPLFAVFIGLALQVEVFLEEWYYQCLTIIILLSVSALAFIIATFAFVSDIREARKKERKSKTKNGFPRLF